MELADVGLAGWSSTALEMARLGIPTAVAFDYQPTPADDVVFWSPDRMHYFEAIDRLLVADDAFSRMRLAMRWAHLYLLGHAINFGGDGSQKSVPPRSSEAAVAIEKALLREHLLSSALAAYCGAARATPRLRTRPMPSLIRRNDISGSFALGASPPDSVRLETLPDQDEQPERRCMSAN